MVHDTKKDPEVVKVRLKPTKKELRNLSRVARWEKDSEGTVIVLEPRER